MSFTTLSRTTFIPRKTALSDEIGNGSSQGSLDADGEYDRLSAGNLEKRCFVKFRDRLDIWGINDGKDSYITPFD